MQKEIIVQRLREKGCRITKQRLMLLDVILEEECSSCKEIFYKASRQDKGIGTATVYRMINILEDIGAISRKNMYKIACDRECDVENACTIEFEDNTMLELSAKRWYQVIQTGLQHVATWMDRRFAVWWQKAANAAGVRNSRNGSDCSLFAPNVVL